MTLPASGAISLLQVRAEIGGNGVVTMPSTEVRTLTGVASGPIVLPTNFHGKSGSPTYSLYLSHSLVSKLGTGSLTTTTVTATRVGGTGPFTYAWTKLSGDNGITVTSPLSSSTTFSGDPADSTSIEAVYRCTVTDAGAGNATRTADVTVRLTDPGTQ